MLGWEFPPFISGGLGTACYGLTKAMDQLGMEITFVLPKMVEDKYTTHVKLLCPSSKTSAFPTKLHELKNVRFHTISSPLQPYTTSEIYQKQIEETLRKKHEIQLGNITSASQFVSSIDYSSDMYTEVHRYAAIAAELAEPMN